MYIETDVCQGRYAVTEEKTTTKNPANKTKQTRKTTTTKKPHNVPKISELMLHNSKLVTVYMSKLYIYTNIGTTLLRHENIRGCLTTIPVTDLKVFVMD